MPKLPAFNRRDTKSEDQRGMDLRAGFSIDLWLKLDALTPTIQAKPRDFGCG